MGHKPIPIELRRRIVDAYTSGFASTYEEAAELFDVGRATVSRVLRRYRETGDVYPKPRGGDRRRLLDLEWLEKHAREHPDARLVDRADAFEAERGRRVDLAAIWNGLRKIGWTHKKNT